MEYPSKHYEISQDLLNGRFILSNEDKFEIIIQNGDFYKIFFENTFHYTLKISSEIIYLSSSDTNEKFSRNLMLLLGVFSYELNLKGKNIYEGLFQEYRLEFLINIINESSYKNICRKIEIESMIKNDCKKRNIVEWNGEYETFQFTSAINIFLDKAKDILIIPENT